MPGQMSSFGLGAGAARRGEVDAHNVFLLDKLSYEFLPFLCCEVSGDNSDFRTVPVSFPADANGPSPELQRAIFRPEWPQQILIARTHFPLSLRRL